MLVARVLVNHSDDLEADLLMHFPSLNIKDALTENFTLHQLGVVINRLIYMHGRSALAVALLGVAASWSNEEYLLADIADELRITNWFTMRINRADEHQDIPFPELVRRPGAERKPSEERKQTETAPPPDSKSFASANEIAGVLSGLQVGSFR